MITVHVKLFATLRRHYPNLGIGEATPVELPDGATIGQLIEHLRLPANEVKVVFVNGIVREGEYALSDGDEVGIFPAVGGVVSPGIQHVTFPTAGGGPLLEGVLHLPDGSGSFPAAVVCHPHPLMGGTMDNAVVVAVCSGLAARGWAALRFNFRGAGRSAGSFDEGRGEMDDVAGAVDFLCASPLSPPLGGMKGGTGWLAVAGYSFGAEVGLRYAAKRNVPRVGWLVGISLVQEHYTDPFLDADPRPKLFIAGEHDPWAPADALREYVARLSPPTTLHVIPHTDHFFAGREAEVATSVADFLTAP